MGLLAISSNHTNSIPIVVVLERSGLVFLIGDNTGSSTTEQKIKERIIPCIKEKITALQLHESPKPKDVRRLVLMTIIIYGLEMGGQDAVGTNLAMLCESKTTFPLTRGQDIEPAKDENQQSAPHHLFAKIIPSPPACFIATSFTLLHSLLNHMPQSSLELLVDSYSPYTNTYSRHHQHTPKEGTSRIQALDEYLLDHDTILKEPGHNIWLGKNRIKCQADQHMPTNCF
ncbi:hypothetical protein SADUNF_Sadunf01G0129300 [Salix dunnii]|uniref:Uncharacterized protein n=1 Tax=Salix dunnii TaxID=1413687 RepID=A0A835NBL8_9ROSI|nr:hypothetical protein SADUNF_Sadunf01G0129300 [Salix dunnii]